MRLSVFAIGLCAAMSAAHAGPLVQNGGFEQTTNGTNRELHFYDGQTPSIVNGWTSPSGVGFVYASGTAETTGGYWTGTPSQGNLQLWGPDNGAANGLTASSPVGGNFIALDSNQTIGEGKSLITQTINGLTGGRQYRVSFYWGASQYRVAGGSLYSPGSLYNGATFSSFVVSLGSETHSTPQVNIGSHGFSGWLHETLTFTATSASEDLTFLGLGTAASSSVPGGLPPVAVLDGVSMTAVPEAATMGLLGLGLGLAAAARRRR